MVFRKAEFATASQATQDATAVETETVHGLKKTIKVQLMIFQSQARSPPPPWREKEDLKRLLRRKEQLHSSKDSTESKFRAVRHSPKAHVLYSWLAFPIHLVFRKRKSTAKPNDGRQKCGSRNLSVDTQLCCRLLLAFRESMCLNFH